MTGSCETLTVADVPAVAIPCLPSASTLSEVAQLLGAAGVGTVLLGPDPLVVVTDGDVVRAVADGCGPDTDVMSLDLARATGITELMPLGEVLAVMLERGLRSVVVVDGQRRPVGLLTLAAVVHAMLGGPPWLGALRLALHIESHSV